MEIISITFPVFFIALVGYIAQRQFKWSLYSLTQVSLYLLSPALVLVVLMEADIAQEEISQVIFFHIIFIILLGLISYAISKVFTLPSTVESTLIANSLFINTVNYGLPIILLAFGDKGFQYAVIFSVTQLVFMYTIGVFLVSRGKFSLKNAIINVFKMPSVYMALLAILFRLCDIPLTSTFIWTPMVLLSEAAIPVFLLLLGMQLYNTSLKCSIFNLTLLTIIRLIISPLVAFFILTLMDVTETMKNVLILLSAMPSAVTILLLSIEYDCDPEFASAGVFVTTIVSFISVPLLLYFM